MFFTSEPSAAALESLAGTRHSAYWLDRAERPPSTPELMSSETADLLVVGGGFTGL